MMKSDNFKNFSLFFFDIEIGLFPAFHTLLSSLVKKIDIPCLCMIEIIKYGRNIAIFYSHILAYFIYGHIFIWAYFMAIFSKYFIAIFWRTK